MFYCTVYITTELLLECLNVLYMHGLPIIVVIRGALLGNN